MARPPAPADTLRWISTLNMADRSWRLEFSFLPASASWAPQPLLTIGMMLLVGVSLTALLSW